MNLFMLCLQTCPLDIAEAEDLVELICELEPRVRGSVEFVLAIRRDVSKERAQAIQRRAKEKFFRSTILTSRRYGTGHPGGCNDLWQDTMMQIWELKKYGHTQATGVLMFEPDCTPLREDWIDILRAEWERAEKAGKEVIGTVCQHGQDFEHINGNAIVSTDLIQRHPELCSSGMNWDIYHRKLLLRIGMHTDAIEQLYRYKDQVRQTFIEEMREKYRKPALLHGVRNGSARTAIRNLIESGEIRKPVVPKIPQVITRPGEIKFSISILAMNNLSLTERCLDSVITNSTQPFELLLWDNGSKDGTWGYFQELHSNIKHVTITRWPTNAGFIYPNQSHALDAKGKYFICLNNDTTVPEQWLEKLERPFLEHQSAAITGPEGTCCILNNHFHGGPGITPEYIEGSCLCIRMDLVREHGLFSDTVEFAYGEDADLSLRMREQGYTLHHVPFQITHQRSSTSKHIKGIEEIQKKNHDALQKRWGHYIKVRQMDFPILFMRSGAIGDVLLTTPVIRAMKKQRPLSRIYVETMFPELFRDNPNVYQAEKEIISHHYEDRNPLVVDLNMAYENRPNINIVEAYHQVAGTDSDGDDSEEILVNDQDLLWAEKKLGEGKWCAVHCSPTTWAGKNWPARNWGKITNWLRNNEWKVVLVGGGLEPPVVADQYLVNKTTIHQLAAVLKLSRLSIGHDSFPFHCAMAVRTKAIALFGVSSSSIVIPKGSTGIGVDAIHPMAGARHKVSGQTFVDVGDNNPMDAITVERVIETIKTA